MQNKNLTKFYCKEEIKIEQGYNKETYPKLVLNKLKVMGILFLFIFIKHFVQGSFSKNFLPTYDPCSFTCAHV
jgi:hypothetical protein